jgi:hypothetical protein
MEKPATWKRGVVIMSCREWKNQRHGTGDGYNELSRMEKPAPWKGGGEVVSTFVVTADSV